jgi:hypothetical protein
MAKLTGSTDSYFGYSVAVAGNWIVVGAYGDYLGSGSVFVFTKTSSSLWTQMTQLLAADGLAEDNFGTSVSISKDASTIVVGAGYGDLEKTIPNSGAAYLFRTTNTATTMTSTTTTMEYTQMGKFVADDRETEDGLGASIAIENNIVVVGVWGDDNYTGSVYILDTGSPENDSSAPPPLPATTDSPPSIAPVPQSTTTAPSPIGTEDDTTTKSSSTNNGLSTGAIVGIAAIAGVVVFGVAILNYRIKMKHQQQSPPPPAAAGSDAPIMANVVFEPPVPQPVNEATLDAAAVFLDPSVAAMAQMLPATIIDKPAGEKLPRFKDQVMSGPAANMTSSVAAALEEVEDEDPKKNSQQQGEEETEQVPEQALEDQPLPPQQEEQDQLMQRSQQIPPDPPAASEQHRQLPTYMDRISI